MVVGGLAGMETPLRRAEHIEFVGQDVAVLVHDADPQGVRRAFYPHREHFDRSPIPYSIYNMDADPDGRMTGPAWDPASANPISLCTTRISCDYWTRGLDGYDVALTWRRSPVQIRPGPLIYQNFSFSGAYLTPDSILKRLLFICTPRFQS